MSTLAHIWRWATSKMKRRKKTCSILKEEVSSSLSWASSPLSQLYAKLSKLRGLLAASQKWSPSSKTDYYSSSRRLRRQRWHKVWKFGGAFYIFVGFLTSRPEKCSLWTALFLTQRRCRGVVVPDGSTQVCCLKELVGPGLALLPGVTKIGVLRVL